jgi:Excreted virulence factor EspC, type VII ESX diderm
MAGQFHVEPPELHGYSAMLGRAADQFTDIERHAREKGGDTSGFTGLLALLVPVVNGVVGLYADTLQSANQKMTEVKNGLDQTAAGYEQQDQSGATEITAAGSGLGGGN